MTTVGNLPHPTTKVIITFYLEFLWFLKALDKSILLIVMVVAKHLHTRTPLKMVGSPEVCLQWKDFRAHSNKVPGNFRGRDIFTDVTLACEDGQQVEAHRLVLAASSPFFSRLLLNLTAVGDSHPLICLTWVKRDLLEPLLDLFYHGEITIAGREHLEVFKTLADDLGLKNLAEKSSVNDWRLSESEPVTIGKAFEEKNKDAKSELSEGSKPFGDNFKVTCDLDEVESAVKSMMGSREKKWDHQNGRYSRKRKVCVICNKEGSWANIKKHIEVNHIDISGHSNICKLCGKMSTSRYGLGQHISTYHKEVVNPNAIEPMEVPEHLNICNICGKGCTSSHGLSQHMYYHHKHMDFILPSNVLPAENC